MRSGESEDKISPNNQFSVIALLAIRNWKVSRRRPERAGLGRTGWTGSEGTTLLVVPTIAALAAHRAAGAAVVVAGEVAGVGSVGGVIRAPAAARWGDGSVPWAVACHPVPFSLGSNCSGGRPRTPSC